MQYTPHSMAGMNNATAEIAAADAYSDAIRYFTVGMDGGSNEPRTQLSPTYARRPCRAGRSCRSNWTAASSETLGGQKWDTFSAVCWLFGRDLFTRLDQQVPIGLISSNWGGTPIQSWQPLASALDCKGKRDGSLYNAMIAPYTVGPMALRGVTWYQGESNVGQAGFYQCAFPSMIRRWREAFKAPALWFGFVQIAGYRYSVPYGPYPHKPEIDHSHYAGDLRQAQLAALALPKVGLSTAIDTGDWLNIHPPDKQTVATRLADQAMFQEYELPAYNQSVWYPMYAAATLTSPPGARVVEVTVTVRDLGGRPVPLTTTPPRAASQSTTLGKGPDLPRNKCVTAVPQYGQTFAQDCGYPSIHVTNGSAGGAPSISLNATARIDGADRSSIRLSAPLPASLRARSLVVTATSYGRASWPMTRFFSAQNGLPLLPWLKDGVGSRSGGEEDAGLHAASMSKGAEPPHRLPAWAEASGDDELGMRASPTAWAWREGERGWREGSGVAVR